MPPRCDYIAAMQIPGNIDPVPVPRAGTVARRWAGRTCRPFQGPDSRRARSSRAGAKQAKLRAKQIWHWIYNRGVSDFQAMTDIAKAQHPWLADHFVITRPEVVEAQVSVDGTRKWLLRTHDGEEFEMVFIPDADRGTLVRLIAGRLHAQLPLLPHRHDAAGPQPDAGRDCRAGDAGARQLWANGPASPKGGCSPTS